MRGGIHYVKEKIFYFFDELFNKESVENIELPKSLNMESAKEIIKECYIVFNALKNNIYILEESIKCKVDDDELSYLCIFFIVFIFILLIYLSYFMRLLTKFFMRL